MEELKNQYNSLLIRCIRAELYMDNPENPEEVKEKYMPEFKKIIHQLNNLLEHIGEYTHDEVCNGFQI